MIQNNSFRSQTKFNPNQIKNTVVKDSLLDTTAYSSEIG